MMHHDNDQHGDFIAKCPNEIICSIFSYMDEYSAAQSLDVCRIWRYKILACPSPWRVLSINDNHIDTCEKHKVLLLLPILATHIETLHIRALLNKVEQHIELIKTGGFSNLKSLVFEYDDDSVPFFDLFSAIYDILPYIVNTLTHLELDSQLFVNTSLLQLVSTCKKLQSIKLNVHSLSPTLSEERQVAGILTSLTRIDLSSQYPVPVSAIAPIFRLAPHLRHLVLRCLFDGESHILSELDSHCPELVEIRTGYLNIPYYNINEMSLNTIQTNSTSIDISQGGVGNVLEFLAVSELRSAKPLCDRLSKSYKSLRVMGLNMDPEGSRHSSLSDWCILSSFTMENLTLLYIRNGCKVFYEQLPLILCQCPSLESLKIENYRPDYDTFDLNEMTRNDLYDTIAGLKKLKSLYLHDFTISGEGFKRMLQHHHQQLYAHTKNRLYDRNNFERTCLQDLQIHYCDGFSDAILQRIGMVQNLHSLAISCYNSIGHDIHTSNVTQFTQSILENLPMLSYLELSGLPLTHEAVKCISKCKSLDTLCLGTMAGLVPQHIDLLKKHITNVSVEN